MTPNNGPRERGTVLIEMLVIGFGVMLVVLPLLTMVMRMAEAADVAAGDARATATWVARHGELPDVEPRSVVDVEIHDGIVTVHSSVDVPLIAVGGARVTTTVSARYDMPISPYRSGR